MANRPVFSTYLWGPLALGEIPGYFPHFSSIHPKLGRDNETPAEAKCLTLSACFYEKRLAAASPYGAASGVRGHRTPKRVNSQPL